MPPVVRFDLDARLTTEDSPMPRYQNRRHLWSSGCCLLAAVQEVGEKCWRLTGRARPSAEPHGCSGKVCRGGGQRGCSSDVADRWLCGDLGKRVTALTTVRSGGAGNINRVSRADWSGLRPI